MNEPTNDAIFAPKQTRSGALYYQKGERGTKSKKSRSGTRRRQRLKKLRTCLYQIIKAKKCARQRGTKSCPGFQNEMVYNLALQQIGREHKGEYFDSDIGLISQLMGQIQDGINTQGYNLVQQFYLNKGLKVFQENGEKAAKKELDQLVRRHC